MRGNQESMAGFTNAQRDLNRGSDQPMPSVTVTSDTGHTPRGGFPWEMMGLGLEEPLPPPDLMDEL